MCRFLPLTNNLSSSADSYQRFPFLLLSIDPAAKKHSTLHHRTVCSFSEEKMMRVCSGDQQEFWASDYSRVFDCN
jgi:hypothetical protein